jgi:hypothetical protein
MTTDPKKVLARLAEYRELTLAKAGEEGATCSCPCGCPFPLRRPGELRIGICSECGSGKCKEEGL